MNDLKQCLDLKPEHFYSRTIGILNLYIESIIFSLRHYSKVIVIDFFNFPGCRDAA
jgi:hypothetical protein